MKDETEHHEPRRRQTFNEAFDELGAAAAQVRAAYIESFCAVLRRLRRFFDGP